MCPATAACRFYGVDCQRFIVFYKLSSINDRLALMEFMEYRLKKAFRLLHRKALIKPVFFLYQISFNV